MTSPTARRTIRDKLTVVSGRSRVQLATLDAAHEQARFIRWHTLLFALTRTQLSDSGGTVVHPLGCGSNESDGVSGLSVALFAVSSSSLDIYCRGDQVFSMEGKITDTDTAVEIARDYADDECVGEFGEVLEASRENHDWIVEFRTHTFSDTYKQRVQLSPIGNVFSHDRIP
jgi:hypothetical protein